MKVIFKLRSLLGLLVIGLLSGAAQAAPKENALDLVRSTMQFDSIFALSFIGPQADQLYSDLAGDFVPLTESKVTGLYGPLFHCTKGKNCETLIKSLQLVSVQDKPAENSLKLVYETPFSNGSLRLTLNLSAVGKTKLLAYLKVDAFRNNVLISSHALNPMRCGQNGIFPPAKEKCLFQSKGSDADLSSVSRTVTPSAYKNTDRMLLSVQGDAAISLFEELASSWQRALDADQPNPIEHSDAIDRLDAYVLGQDIACYHHMEKDAGSPEAYRCHISYKATGFANQLLNLAGTRLELKPEFLNASLSRMLFRIDGKTVANNVCVHRTDAKADSLCSYDTYQVNFQYDLDLPPMGGAVAVGWGFTTLQ